jgi:HEAT repeat protein
MVRTNQAKIEDLISRLGSKDKNDCTDAFKNIIESGAPAAKPLVRALSRPDEKIQLQVFKILDRLELDWTTHADNEAVISLIKSLDSRDGRIRVRARQFLVSIGPLAVPALVEAMEDKDQHIRWESAKALGQIGDPLATQALIKALDDKIFEIRWLAAEGLSAIGRPAIIPLLKRLIEEPESPWVRDGVHYVLRNMETDASATKIQAVLDTLEDVDAAIEAPIAAKEAIASLS